jgi:hypothetical protein
VILFCVFLHIAAGGKRSTCQQCGGQIQACSLCEWRTGKQRGTVWHHRYAVTDQEHKGVPK